MEKQLNIVGLDCGNCALTLEKYLEKIDGVKRCIVNFSTSKIIIDFDGVEFKALYRKITSIAKQVLPQVKITEEVVDDNKNNVIDIMLYFVGIMLGLLVITCKLNIVFHWIFLLVSSLLIGYKTFWSAMIQLKHFKINENTLITLSLIGAIAIGEYIEGLMVIALYTLGKMLESKAVNYSRKSISSLIDNQPDFAVIIENDIERKVKPHEVKIDQCIIVKPGEKIALDGIIVSGNATINKSHLTGESLPVEVKEGDLVESGSIVLDSAIVIKVTSEYNNSTVAKILSLVSDATNKKSKTESIISKFSSWYTFGVMVLSLIVFCVTMLILKDFNTAIYRGLVFLVVSCPCAFAISVPLSYFSGIGRCSKQGILVKGSVYIDSCAKINKIIFDKTGTLTYGQFKVVDVKCDGILSNELLDVVVAGEKNSMHPIAKAICNYHQSINKKYKITNFQELVGLGIKYNIGEDEYFVGRAKTKEDCTMVSVVKNDVTIGQIFLSDVVKSESYEAIGKLKKSNIKTMMLTGDNRAIASKVAGSLAIDDFCAELLPNEKYEIINSEISNGNIVGFVGDGLNDAPALALSNVGISMGILGSQATIECSDVVIADDNLMKISELINISKYTKHIVKQNIIFSAFTKLLFLLLGALGITGMLFAVFADVGVTLIAILNSLRIIRYKRKDKNKKVK